MYRFELLAKSTDFAIWEIPEQFVEIVKAITAELIAAIDRYCEWRRREGTQWSRAKVLEVYGIYI